MSASKLPTMMRGSLITLRRRCGKQGCRCQEGQLHEAQALSCLMDGKHHVITIAAEDLIHVEAAVTAYAEAREHLEQQCRHGIAWLRARVERRKGLRVRKGCRA